MPKIIISYRRQDSEAITGRIRDRLANQYGNESVFMDIDSIPFGADFREHIGEALRETDVLIAVIGPKWTGVQKGGRTRIREENDPVKIEVENAMERGIPVIPILVNNATMPKPTELPDRLKELSYRNAATVDSGRDFHQHMDRLTRSMDQILSSRATTRGAAKEATATDVIAAAEALPAADPGNTRQQPVAAVESKTSDAAAATVAAVPQATALAPSRSRKWRLAVAAGAVICMIAAGAAYFYSKPPPNPAANNETIKPVEAQIDKPVTPTIAAFDTSCKREDGSGFYDDFKSPDRGWGETGPTYYFNDGQMVLKAKQNATEQRIYLPLLFKNAAICSEITTPSELKNADGAASAGIVFWAADYQNFYISVVFADSTYAIYRKASGTWAIVVPRTKADAVRPGPNAVNQVKVVTGSNVATLFLNGAKIADFWGQPPARGGAAGLYSQSEADTQNEWKFSSIAVARINDAAGPFAQALVPAQDTALLDACKPNASVAFFDDFNPHNPGWFAPADTHSFKDGQVIFKPKSQTNAQMFFPSLIFKTGTVCADIKSPSEPKGSGSGGGSLIFWAIDYQNYYAASVYRDGSYDVFRKIDGRWETVIAHTMAASIRQGSGAVNRMKVAFSNDLATVIINEANLIQFRGQPAASGGFVGIAGQSDADAENEWTFLNAVVMVDEKVAMPQTSPSISPAATTAASACKLSSIPVAFFDDFKSPDPGWGKTAADYNFQDGQMVLKSKNGAPQPWIYTPLVFKSATICSDFVSPAGLQKVDGMAAGGIIFWAADYQNYYVAQTFTDGTYAIYRKANGKWIPVSGRTKAEDIRPGPGAVNRMKITTAGNKTTLFVNNKKLVEIWGQSPGRGGAVGLYAQSETNQDEEWHFSNLIVLQDILEQPIYSAEAMAISAKCNDKASLAFFDDFKSLDPGWGSLPAVDSLEGGALNVKAAKNTSSTLIYFPLLFNRATFCSEIKSPPPFDNPADAGSAGIMFWVADYKNYYVALLGPDGTYLVSRRVDGDWLTVVPRSKATMISQGPDAVNRMKITIEPNAATITINDKIAIGFRGEPPAGATAFGLYAESGTNQENLWRFANLAVFE
jgi:TIR domain